MGRLGVSFSEILLGLSNRIVKFPSIIQADVFNYEFLSVVRDFQSRIDSLFSEMEQAHYRVMFTPREYSTVFGS